MQLAHQCLHRGFASIDLAAGLHEGLGAAFAYQQGAALGADQQGGGDADGVGHGLGSPETMAGEDPMGFLA
ncbi:hypothetical protein D3C85_1525300 [compost metagenome]